MVVVKLKPFNEILKTLNGYRKVTLMGCELGSGRCMQGGLKEAKEVAQFLENNGKEIVEVLTLGGTCIVERVRKLKFKNTDIIVSLACGAGTQVLSEETEIPVVTGVSTLFIGSDSHREVFKEYCIACGDCIISTTGSICPVARCPKSLKYGPCGGAIGGMCEVNNDVECIWFTIERKLKKINKELHLFKDIEFTDFSISNHPRRFENEI
ncbi:methylenetetrahydrofolate reductase C-terminal domain-containing protein [Desulfurobacterium atlanticum]|uniref:Methylene-tetrahydrofolate reductase C terminal n=1 Tax=Desulfurobacterium atlanticum TaxID=240169 RepID=A0A238YBZ6_9BACT|nr:methylenetetrahydrofolate reductase C-terminal domain-containing protein [Desulfurobacterium atlanticum]SNR68492.1 Methylene-tetrahydrofolate reductase C terminal [Desulfurobacterium atlanticum]